MEVSSKESSTSFLPLLLHLAAGTMEITGALTYPREPRPHPKEGMLVTKEILTVPLLGLPFPVFKPL